MALAGPALVVMTLLTIAVFGGFRVTTPDRTAAQSLSSRAEARHQGAVTVRAAVLTDDESQRYFGASLADHGIQAIWLGVDNAGEPPLEFLPIVTDREYFSEAEVEQLLHAWWRGSANASIRAAVAEAPMPDIIPQRQAAAGFVFTHREGGLKLFGVGFEPAVRNCCSGSPSRSAAGPMRSKRLISATSIRPDRLRIPIWRRCAKGGQSYRAAPPTRVARITVIRSISSSSGTGSTHFSHLSGGDGGSTSRSIFTAYIDRFKLSCSAANISTRQSARCMFSDGSRTSHCKRRAIP